MKIDKYIKDISDRLHHNNTDNNNIIDDNEIDDYYYIDRKQDPPRFHYYRHIRLQKCTDEDRKKSFIGAIDTITQDELDFILKRELRPTPEQRYQDEKRNFLFHELSCYMRGLGEEDYGCTGAGCILECRYFGDYGRIEDEEIIEKHNQLVESYRKKNAIVDPPTEAEMLKARKELSYLFT